MRAEPQHRKEGLRAVRIAGGLVLAFTVVACAPDEGRARGFDDVRVVQADAKLRLWADSRERFGFDGARTQTSAAATNGQPSGAGASSPAAGLSWVAPEGWTRGADRPLRNVTFVAAGDVECYVAVLAGDGGGVRSNLDRWRAQMGGEPLTSEELAALEHVPALGVRAALIEVEGNYRGMNGETVEGGALLGAVAVLEDRTVFVKLIGPLDAVRRENARFRAFVTSLEVAR